MKIILSIFYYIFIFWAVYLASVFEVLTIQIYRFFQEKKLLREVCSAKGHLWTHYSVDIGSFNKRYRECLRCRKKQSFRANKGYKDESKN